MSPSNRELCLRKFLSPMYACPVPGEGRTGQNLGMHFWCQPTARRHLVLVTAPYRINMASCSGPT